MTKTKAYHDVGGDDFGPVPMIDGEYQLWEKRVDAMMRLLFARRCADAGRRAASRDRDAGRGRLQRRTLMASGAIAGQDHG